jgi:hypothetical protein
VFRQESSRHVVFSHEGVRRAAVEDLKAVLRALEDVLSEAWSKKRFGERTNLEVVVMNRAADGYVTVAAWATNRPLSLERRVVDPTFYKKTEAATLYWSYGDTGTRAPIHIIADVGATRRWSRLAARIVSTHPSEERFAWSRVAAMIGCGRTSFSTRGTTDSARIFAAAISTTAGVGVRAGGCGFTIAAAGSVAFARAAIASASDPCSSTERPRSVMDAVQ